MRFIYLLMYSSQVFKPDDKNGMEIQNQVDALLERQKQENQPSIPKTPSSRYRVVRINMMLTGGFCKKCPAL